jgi:hypothetical protein
MILKEEFSMDMNWKKKFMVGGMTAALSLGVLAGCGDGVDQDNGVSDGEQKDEVDNNEEVQEGLENDMNDAEQELEENGIGDGVDQDNGPSDGEQKDDVDDENKNPETN